MQALPSTLAIDPTHAPVLVSDPGPAAASDSPAPAADALATLNAALACTSCRWRAERHEQRVWFRHPLSPKRYRRVPPELRAFMTTQAPRACRWAWRAALGELPPQAARADTLARRARHGRAQLSRLLLVRVVQALRLPPEAPWRAPTWTEWQAALAAAEAPPTLRAVCAALPETFAQKVPDRIHHGRALAHRLLPRGGGSDADIQMQVALVLASMLLLWRTTELGAADGGDAAETAAAAAALPAWVPAGVWRAPPPADADARLRALGAAEADLADLGRALHHLHAYERLTGGRQANNLLALMLVSLLARRGCCYYELSAFDAQRHARTFTFLHNTNLFASA